MIEKLGQMCLADDGSYLDTVVFLASPVTHQLLSSVEDLQYVLTFFLPILVIMMPDVADVCVHDDSNDPYLVRTMIMLCDMYYDAPIFVLGGYWQRIKYNDCRALMSRLPLSDSVGWLGSLMTWVKVQP